MRAARLRAAGARLLESHLRAQVGLEARVLVERGGQGRSENWTPYRLEAAGLAPGAVVRATGERVEAQNVIGRLAA